MKETANRMGLTGGIGCGKSTVARFMEEAGFKVVDSDAIARDVVRPGEEGHEKIIDAFGNFILNEDRTIHRSRLGQLVFSDPIKRNLLNSLLHPLIRKRWQARCQELTEAFPGVSVVVVIPLLFEAGLQGEFDSVACVGCSSGIQRDRLRIRNLTEQEVDDRISAQMPTEQKMENSQYVLWNNGSLESLENQTRRLCYAWENRDGLFL